MPGAAASGAELDAPLLLHSLGRPQAWQSGASSAKTVGQSPASLRCSRAIGLPVLLLAAVASLVVLLLPVDKMLLPEMTSPRGEADIAPAELIVANVDGIPRVSMLGMGAPPPPLYRIKARGLRDAGLQHGRVARERILGWFASDQMAPIFAFARANPKAFAELKRRNAEVFPEYVEEMEGIAAGAGVTLDQVWCANLMNEITNLLAMDILSKNGVPKTWSQKQKDMAKERQMACSDIFAVAPGGYKDGFACGHNEDYSASAKHFYYYLAYTFEEEGRTPADGTEFTSCAGMTYPAHLIGSPATFNVHGLYASQNHLTPMTSQADGLSLAFVKRRALCESRTYEEFMEKLTNPVWSSGASVNFMDLNSRRMAQVEMWEDRSDVLEVSEAMGNYSHFNEYRRLADAEGRRLDDPRPFATDPRQRRTDSLPAPRSAADVARGLSDYQVFSRIGTVTTVIVNGSTWTVSVWCCGEPSASSPPLYTWNIRTFF